MPKKERESLPILRIAEKTLVVQGLFVYPFPCNVWLSLRSERQELILSFNGALGKYKTSCRKIESGIEIDLPQEIIEALKPRIGRTFVLKETTTPQTYVVSLR